MNKVLENVQALGTSEAVMNMLADVSVPEMQAALAAAIREYNYSIESMQSDSQVASLLRAVGLLTLGISWAGETEG